MDSNIRDSIIKKCKEDTNAYCGRYPSNSYKLAELVFLRCLSKELSNLAHKYEATKRMKIYGINHLDIIFEFYDDAMCKEIDNIERTNWSNIWQ